MMFRVISLLLLSTYCSAAPTCEAGYFCYTPDESTKITLSRSENNLHLKVYDEKSSFRNIRLSQKDREDVVVNCEADSKNIVMVGGMKSCQAVLKLEDFDKDLPISIKLSETQISDQIKLDSITPPAQEGLTKQQRRQFSKAHAILMIFGWLLFVPSGFLFGRLGKDLFKEQTLFGTAVWFQIHRAANFMGVVCICTSMLCIFISMQWTWKGTGSKSKYWTEVHTDLGVISTVLAVAQPINSLFRCGPTHSQRIIFNWAHRCIGILAYTLALTAIIIAAVQFRKIWNEPLLELVLVCLPIVICLVASVVFTFLESERFRSKSSYGDPKIQMRSLKNRRSQEDYREPHVLKQPTIFWAVGVFFCIAFALSLLVVNGYK